MLLHLPLLLLFLVLLLLLPFLLLLLMLLLLKPAHSYALLHSFVIAVIIVMIFVFAIICSSHCILGSEFADFYCACFLLLPQQLRGLRQLLLFLVIAQREIHS
jgi:hypothetical protein